MRLRRTVTIALGTVLLAALSSPAAQAAPLTDPHGSVINTRTNGQVINPFTRTNGLVINPYTQSHGSVINPFSRTNGSVVNPFTDPH